jgi:hypothetical protein
MKKDLREYYGWIGLYTEDAHVYFDSVVVRRPQCGSMLSYGT